MDEKLLNMELPVDTSLPSLFSFTPRPLVAGQSSSKDQVKKQLLMKGMMNEMLCNLQPAAWVVDPEPFNLLIKIINDQPSLMNDEFQYLIPMFGIFHLRKHLMEGAILDHTNYLWFFHEVLPIFKKEKNHETSFNNMVNQMMAKLSTSKATDRAKYINSNLKGENEDLEGGDYFFPEDKGRVGPECDRYVLLSHMMEMIEEDKKRKGRSISHGHTTTSREPFTFYKDPQLNMIIFNTCYKAFQRVELPEDGGNEIEILRNLKEEIELIILPLLDLFDSTNPSASRFFANLPRMIAKIAHDGHPRLLNGFLPFLQWLDRWRMEDNKIVEFISYHIHSLNDQWIENFNSIVKSRSQDGRPLTFDELKKEVACAGYKRDIDNQLGHFKKQKNLLLQEFHKETGDDKVEAVVEVIRTLVGRYESIQPWVGDLNWKVANKIEVGMMIVNEKVANFDCGSPQELEELNSTISTLSRLGIDQINEIFNSVIMRLESDMNEGTEMELEDEKVDDEMEMKPYIRIFPTNKKRAATDLALFLLHNSMLPSSPDDLRTFVEELGVKVPNRVWTRKQKKQKRKKASKHDEKDTPPPKKKRK